MNRIAGFPIICIAMFPAAVQVVARPHPRVTCPKLLPTITVMIAALTSLPYQSLLHFCKQAYQCLYHHTGAVQCSPVTLSPLPTSVPVLVHGCELSELTKTTL